jgi:hypothetical protein
MARLVQSVGLGKEESEYNEEGHVARVFLGNERGCKGLQWIIFKKPERRRRGEVVGGQARRLR